MRNLTEFSSLVEKLSKGENTPPFEVAARLINKADFLFLDLLIELPEYLRKIGAYRTTDSHSTVNKILAMGMALSLKPEEFAKTLETPTLIVPGYAIIFNPNKGKLVHVNGKFFLTFRHYELGTHCKIVSSTISSLELSVEQTRFVVDNLCLSGSDSSLETIENETKRTGLLSIGSVTLTTKNIIGIVIDQDIVSTIGDLTVFYTGGSKVEISKVIGSTAAIIKLVLTPYIGK